ncbi:MAG: amidohydrolase family protein [Abditibacteriaceae bacterium]
MTANFELFDPTKSFGPTCDAPPQFLTAADLLTAMDRLGIARSLVYYSEARSYLTGAGNRWLVEKLDATPGAQNRLIPAAVISPAARFNSDTLPQLKEQMEQGRIRALRYFSRGSNLRQMEPLMEELMPFSPVLFLDAREGPSFDEILSFATHFPELPITLMQTMWPGELQLADLMERCPNLHIDISWMHSDQTLEWMVKYFGAERILFGGGPDSHNGAAIASLVHAEISDNEKILIASKNLQRLLGLEQLAPTGITPLSPAREDKPLWNAYLRGEKLEVDIVDAHAHPTAMGGWLRETVDPDALAARMARVMDRIGINVMCMAGVRACFGDALVDHVENETRLGVMGGRFLGYVTFNPYLADQIEPCLDDYFSRDYYIGFKLLNDYWGLPITDAVFAPMWRYADRHSLPILMHTWVGPNDDPAMLSEIAPAHPNAILILGHSGGSNHKSAIALAKANPNVYLEWCGCFCSGQRWEEVIAEVGTQQVLFGSDAAAHNLDWELGRMLSLDLPDETLIPILGSNMRNILARRR